MKGVQSTLLAVIACNSWELLLCSLARVYPLESQNLESHKVQSWGDEKHRVPWDVIGSDAN